MDEDNIIENKETHGDLGVAMTVIEEGIRAKIELEHRTYYKVSGVFQGTARTYHYKLARWISGKSLVRALENGEELYGVVTIGGVTNLNTSLLKITAVEPVKAYVFERLPSAVIAIPDLRPFIKLVANQKAAQEARAEISSIMRKKELSDKLESLRKQLPDMEAQVEEYEKLVRDTVL